MFYLREPAWMPDAMQFNGMNQGASGKDGWIRAVGCERAEMQ